MFVKRDRGWLALAFVYDGAHCKEYLHLRDNRDNLREAEKLAREIEAEIRAGTFDYARRFPNSKRLARFAPSAVSDPSLGEFARAWLEERRAHLTPASHNHYRLLLKNHLFGFAIADKRLTAITDGDVALLIGALKERFAGSNRAGTRTVNMVIARLRTILATALRRKLIADDPMRYVRNLRQAKADVDPFDLPEALALIDAAEGWERAFVAVLIFTGMRPNEALALGWSQVDWAHNLLRVRRSVGRDGLALPKTANSEREVEMIGFVAQALKEQRARSQLKGELVFPSGARTPVDLDNFRARNWPRLLRRAGFRPRTIYQCRHTFARLAIEQNDTPQHVAAQLGHASVRMVFEVYGRWLKRPESAALAALDRAISIVHPSSIFGGESAAMPGTRR